MMYREKLAETLSQELIQAKQLIAFCRELSIAIYDEKSVGMVKSILSQNPAYEGVLDFQKAELWVLYKTASNKNDFEELIQKSQVLLKTHENDGEILRFEGYGLYRQGYLKEAEDKYKMAIKYTRNGFVWKEAKELLGIDAYQIADFSQEAAEQDEEEE